MKSLINNRSVALLATAASVALSAGTAHAYLGGFEKNDGYQPFLNMVQHYNAGQYGANSGYLAMAPVTIAPNSGLWQAINGGFFGPGGVSYATGHQNFDRTYVNSNGSLGQADHQALVLTTNHEGVNGPALKYKYNLDSSDLGVAPSATGGTVINTSFWTRGYLDSGLVPVGYFGNEITFEDSLGNVGFRLGLTRTSTGDKVTYWNGSSLFTSTISGNSGYYDQWNITLDLANNTVSASYYQFTTNTTFNLISGVSLQSGMSDFSAMTFRTTPGVNNAKYSSVDDFVFHTNVPAPAAGALLGLGGMIVGRRRR